MLGNKVVINLLEFKQEPLTVYLPRLLFFIYFAIISIISLLLAMNFVMASGESG